MPSSTDGEAATSSCDQCHGSAYSDVPGEVARDDGDRADPGEDARDDIADEGPMAAGEGVAEAAPLPGREVLAP